MSIDVIPLMQFRIPLVLSNGTSKVGDAHIGQAMAMFWT
jgi:hypothetical protein